MTIENELTVTIQILTFDFVLHHIRWKSQTLENNQKYIISTAILA